jgi:Na+-driven multidrug efflux pump
MYFFPERLMSLFTNDAELVAISAVYIRIVGIAYIFNSFTSIYIAAQRGMENTKIGLIIFGISMGLNTFMNWVLIFGNLGAPALGVEGAAISTLIAFSTGFVITLGHAFFSRRFALKAKLIFRPGREMFGKYIKIATPVVMNETLWGLGMAMYPTIMGHMENSKEILAALTIFMNIDRLCSVATFATGVTTAIVIGKEIGGGDKDRSYGTGAALSTVSLLLGAGVGVLGLIATFTLIAPYVYPLFGLSVLAGAIATMMQTINFILMPLQAYNSTMIVGVLRGGGDVRAAALIDLLPLWLFAVPAAALTGLVLQLDIFWVFITISVEGVIKAAAGFWRFRSRRWINDITTKTV